MKWVDHKGLFNVSLRSMSSVHTQVIATALHIQTQNRSVRSISKSGKKEKVSLYCSIIKKIPLFCFIVLFVSNRKSFYNNSTFLMVSWLLRMTSWKSSYTTVGWPWNRSSHPGGPSPSLRTTLDSVYKTSPNPRERTWCSSCPWSWTDCCIWWWGPQYLEDSKVISLLIHISYIFLCPLSLHM